MPSKTPKRNGNTHAGGGLTGKVSWNLGKRHGTDNAALSLPRDDDEGSSSSFGESCEEFYSALEAAANRLISESPGVTRYDFDSEDGAVERLGSMVLDAGQVAARDKRAKKARKAEAAGEDAEASPPASVGRIESGGSTMSLALLHGPTLLPLSELGRLEILRSDPRAESGIVCNKRKCEVSVKFAVYPAGDGGGAAVGTSPVPDSVDTREAMSKEIRAGEGLALQDAAVARAMARVSTSDPPESAAAKSQDGGGGGSGKDEEMVVTAFEVSGAIDYGKLIEKFGSRPLTPHLLRRLENVTVARGTVPRLHRFLRREIFFSHRDIERICELLEGWYGVSPPDEGEVAGNVVAPSEMAVPSGPCPIYLYTGRGPSSAAMHLGHLVPFLFTAWLQRAFQCPLVIQMTDDEKFIFKGEYDPERSGDGSTGPDPCRTGDNLDHFANLTMENARDIIACGFIKDKTFLFSDLDYVGRMYPNIVRIWKAVTVNQVNGVFGFDGMSNIGKAAFPAVQAAPSFGSSFPNVLGSEDDDAGREANLACLIPCAIDQDPYFRLTRDVAHKLVPRNHPLGGKPALIHSKFFPPLQGATGKMSSSDANSAIFLTDTPEDIERKIKVHAFSGGRETKKLQEELGADLDVDVSYQWLRFFLEDDDELARIGREYGSGKGEYWSTGAVKARLVEVLKEIVSEHLGRRSGVDDGVVREWMTERFLK